ncbi:MAG: phage tail protein [Oleiphilus sp.]|nr:MAG: phage tail protein [Oleiphilus sp.]
MSSIFSFNNIFTNTRLPGFQGELDPSQANTGSRNWNLLVVGQRLASGAVDALDPVRITTVAEAETNFGRGSMLANMLKTVLDNNPGNAVWAIALDDVAGGSGGNAAAGSITLAGNASHSGRIVVSIAGKEVGVGMVAGDTPNTMVSQIVAAVNAASDLDVNAAQNGGTTEQIDFTAKHAGETGNALVVKIRVEAASEVTAPTLTSNGTITLTGGTGNPDIVDVLDVMGSDWYRWMIMPYTDDTNLTALETELENRFSPSKQIGCRAFIAFAGTYGAAAAFGDTRNSPHVSCMGTGSSDTPPWIWASAIATVCSNSLANDPTRQMRSLKLNGVKPPRVQDRFIDTQRDLLLFDGISTYTVGSDNSIYLEAIITMYQENAQGLPDDSLLYLNTMEWYEMYRYEQRVLFAPYARDKLAEDSPTLPKGQPIMTPKKAKGLLADWYARLMVGTYGWCEQPENYEPQVVKNGNRLEIIDNPNPVENNRQQFVRSVMTL